MKIKTALAVDRCKIPGQHPAGQCLMLQVTKGSKPDSVSKRWIVRVVIRGKGRRDIGGIGSPPDVTLAQAREMAMEIRKLARSGIDPVQYRKAKIAAAAAEAQKAASQAKTFRECYDDYVADRLTSQSPRYVKRWKVYID
jgi:hypothetical protein